MGLLAWLSKQLCMMIGGLDDLRDELRQANYPIVGIELRPIDGRFAYPASSLRRSSVTK